MSSKPLHPTYDWIDLNAFPSIGHSYLFNNAFFLGDNFPEYIQDWEHRPRETDPQYHKPYPIRLNFVLVLLDLQGSLEIQLNLKRYSLQKGDLLLASPGDLGLFLNASADFQYLVIAIQDSRFFDHADKEMTVDFRKQLMQHPVFSLSASDQLTFKNLYVLLGRKLTEPGFQFKDQLIKTYLSVMAIYGRQWLLDIEKDKPAGGVSENRQQQLFNRFMEELNQHFREQHEIAFYADKLCITPKYMSQIIYQVSGKFAKDWIQEHLILESKALLKSNKYTVLQISEILNFPNPSFFSQYFKRAVGCTPKQYQNSL